MKSMLLLGGAAAVLLVSSTAAVLTPREPECRVVHGTQTPSANGQPLERDHIARDLASIDEEAERFGRAVGKWPLASESIDAKEGKLTAPTRALAWCRATLMADLAVFHRTTEAALLRVASGVDDQADADRTSRVTATSSVVSRPSR